MISLTAFGIAQQRLTILVMLVIIALGAKHLHGLSQA